MARKWGSPGQLRALKKLIAARRAMVRGKGGKSRRTTKRRRNPLHALIANPGTPGRLKLIKRRAKARRSLFIGPIQQFKKKKRKAAPKARTRRKSAKRRIVTKRRKVGVSHMAKKRRRRAGTRRITRAIRVPKRYARRYMKQKGKKRFYINPRRRSRRYRNPEIRGGLVKTALVAIGAGFAASAASAVIDKYAGGRPMIARVGKLITALAIAKFGGRYPQAASAAIGGLAASEGYNIMTRALGGLASAQTPADAIKSVAASAAGGNPAMGALLDGGLGALLNGVPDVEESAYDYNEALSNMAGGYDDDDDE